MSRVKGSHTSAPNRSIMQAIEAALRARGEKPAGVLVRCNIWTRTYRGLRDEAGQLSAAPLINNKPTYWYVGTGGSLRFGVNRTTDSTVHPRVKEALIDEGRARIREALTP